MGKSQRDKGARREREFASLIGESVCRSLGLCKVMLMM